MIAYYELGNDTDKDFIILDISSPTNIVWAGDFTSTLESVSEQYEWGVYDVDYQHPNLYIVMRDTEPYLHLFYGYIVNYDRIIKYDLSAPSNPQHVKEMTPVFGGIGHIGKMEVLGDEIHTLGIQSVYDSYLDSMSYVWGSRSNRTFTDLTQNYYGFKKYRDYSGMVGLRAYEQPVSIDMIISPRYTFFRTFGLEIYDRNLLSNDGEPQMIYYSNKIRYGWFLEAGDDYIISIGYKKIYAHHIYHDIPATPTIAKFEHDHGIFSSSGNPYNYFKINFDGEIGTTYLIETSTDLVNWQLDREYTHTPDVYSRRLKNIFDITVILPTPVEQNIRHFVRIRPKT